MHKDRRSTHLIAFILLGIVMYFIGEVLDEYYVYLGVFVAVNVIAIASIILLTGYSGQVSLGHGALMAVGAYAAVLCKLQLNFPILLCFVFAVLVAAAAGALLGAAAARLSGPYLAGTTLALAIGLPSFANQFALLGGEQGLLFDVGFPPISLGEDFSQFKWFYWIAGLAALISMWLLQNILASRYGRMWRATRGNQVAAQLSGINVGRSKVLAFTLSAGLAGLAGALLCMAIATVAPSAFPLALSFSLLTGAVLSGITTLGGVIVGSVVLVAIPDLAEIVALKVGGSENVTANLPGLLISSLLILTILFVPNGPVEQHRARKARHSARKQD